MAGRLDPRKWPSASSGLHGGPLVPNTFLLPPGTSMNLVAGEGGVRLYLAVFGSCSVVAGVLFQM